jgi:hypothetical protein
MANINSGIYYSLIIILFSILSLRIRIIKQELFSAVTSFHLVSLIFIGIGPLFFYLDDSIPERIGRDNLIETLNLINPFLIIGYLILLYLEHKKRRLSNNKLNFFELLQNSFSKDYSFYFFFILVLSIIGNFFSSYSFAKSGIGSIIPVLSYLVYPITIFIAYTFKRNNSKSIILLFLLVSYFGYQSFFSLWRSQFLLFIFSLLFGIYLKYKSKLGVFIIISVFVVSFILPFQILKREKSEINLNYSEILYESLTLSNSVKINYISAFLSQRINYVRELGYVQFAIANHSLEYRNGDSYKEIFYQLIPRFLWSDKPSYNYTTGYVIPRRAQLVSESDEITSWGVNVIAEFIYNFNYEYLPVFIVLFYLFLNFIDTMTVSLGLKIQNLLLLQVSLFFVTLNIVSIIFSSTYFLWVFLIIIFIDKFSIGSDEDFIIR